jgi:hypothetical protein
MFVNPATNSAELGLSPFNWSSFFFIHTMMFASLFSNNYLLFTQMSAELSRLSSGPCLYRTEMQRDFLGTQRFSDSDIALVHPLVQGLSSPNDSKFCIALSSLSTAVQSGI